LLDLKKN